MDGSYFLWLGTMYLIIGTVQDYRRKMMIDDRYNFFMSGIVASLFTHIHRSWPYILFLVTFALAMPFLFNKIKFLGEADNRALMWILSGFAIISHVVLVMYALIFIACLLFFWLMKEKLFRIPRPMPFYAVLLASFVATGLLYQMY